MSSPAQAGPSAPKEEKRGLGKMLSRVKTVLRRTDGTPSKRHSMPAKPTATTSEAAKKSEAPPKAKPVPFSRYENMEGVTKHARAKLFEERAQKLSERYGLELKPSDWQTSSPDDSVLRTDKSIRMRVRRTCHSCNTTFGASKECPSCKHVRCTQCIRYPPKRTEAEKIASRERRAAIVKAQKDNAPIIPDYSLNEKTIVIKRPSKTGGQDLVHKKPRQRVRRTCHECQTIFTAGNKTCEKCSHVRCTDCPRDPAKKDKYPFGYPGDEFGPNSIPHYECENCKTLYPTHAEHGVECKQCLRPKSDASPRAQPRKVEPEPNPEVWKSLQAKLEQLKVT